MLVYLKNNYAKFHPDPISNNVAMGFSEEHRPNKHKNKKKNNKMSSGIGSVPDPNILKRS